VTEQLKIVPAEYGIKGLNELADRLGVKPLTDTTDGPYMMLEGGGGKRYDMVALLIAVLDTADT
jgi:hypothetical protein